MLSITPAANAALKVLLASPDVPEGAVVRVASGRNPDGDDAIGITIESGPAADDRFVESGLGIDVVVDPDTSEVLDDKQLDAEIDADTVTFSLRRQAINGGPPGG